MDDPLPRPLGQTTLSELRAALAHAQHGLDDCSTRAAQVMRDLGQVRTGSAQAAEEVVRELHRLLTPNLDAVLCLTQIMVAPGPGAHAVEVAVLAMRLARMVGLDTVAQHEIGLGALLHDIGSEHARAAAALSDSARAREWRQHPDHGQILLRRTGISRVRVNDIVLHHHEHIDGSGFPDGLQDPEIWLGTRIVAVANRYADLRAGAHGPAQTPTDALAQMQHAEARHWDPALLALLQRQLGAHPPGSFVELSDASQGIVVGHHARCRSDPARPLLLHFAAGWTPFAPTLLALASAPELTITRAMAAAGIEPALRQWLRAPSS